MDRRQFEIHEQFFVSFGVSSSLGFAISHLTSDRWKHSNNKAHPILLSKIQNMPSSFSVSDEFLNTEDDEIPQFMTKLKQEK